MSSNSTHILLFPYPAQGHILPMLDFAQKLANHGIKLTILVTPKNLHILKPLLSSNTSIQTLIIPFPKYNNIPEGIENVKDIGNKGNLPIINALGQLKGPIIRWFRDHPNPPVAIVSDFFLGWTLHVAKELGIPRLGFYSVGAILAAVSNFIWNDVKGTLSLPVVKFHDLPKSPTFTAEQIPTVCRVYRESDSEGEFLKDSMVANMTSYGCVFNSFDALEGEYIAYLREKLGHSRIWGVGPLMVRSDTDKCLSAEMSTWLDSCPDGSVLYVCFGSQKLLKKAQMEALATGLEKSEARFIWVVKSLTAQQEESGYGSVPDGFKDRVSDRGLIINGWAPQEQILNHKAVAGFLSHCGWNSMLEGIVAGVVILMWPMEADQFVNARLLTENVGSAFRVCEGADSIPDSAELARTIAESMRGVTVQKLNAEKMREKALEAVGNGSSCVDLKNLVKDLTQIQKL